MCPSLSLILRVWTRYKYLTAAGAPVMLCLPLHSSTELSFPVKTPVLWYLSAAGISVCDSGSFLYLMSNCDAGKLFTAESSWPSWPWTRHSALRLKDIWNWRVCSADDREAGLWKHQVLHQDTAAGEYSGLQYLSTCTTDYQTYSTQSILVGFTSLSCCSR